MVESGAEERELDVIKAYLSSSGRVTFGASPFKHRTPYTEEEDKAIVEYAKDRSTTPDREIAAALSKQLKRPIVPTLFRLGQLRVGGRIGVSETPEEVLGRL